MHSQEKSNDSLGGPASRAQNLDDDLSWYWDQFALEMNPVGISERVLVKDLALRAANLATLGEAVVAARRQTLDSVSEVVSPMMASERLQLDASCLLSSLASGRIEQLERQSLQNARVFCRGLETLRAIQERRHADEVAGAPDARFASERACMSYLLRYRKKSGLLCRRCSRIEVGYWIESRRCWECRACGTQCGIRIGSVFEQSPLPLVTWFAAIRFVLLVPTLSASQLSAKIELRRIATVRSMIEKIRSALNHPDCTVQLVGLDGLYLGSA
jgi:hypothetical protein